MIFLLIMGLLILILGAFYLTNSWTAYREWKAGTLIVVLSLAATIYGGIGTYQRYQHPQNNANRTAQTSSNNTQSAANLNHSNKLQQMEEAKSPQMQKEREMSVLRQMQKNYSKLGDVSYDQKTKTYQIDPTGDSKKAFSAIAQNPSIAGQAGWSNITKPLTTASKQLGKALGKQYSIALVNPDKPNQVIFSAKNGQVTYDIANQK